MAAAGNGSACPFEVRPALRDDAGGSVLAGYNGRPEVLQPGPPEAKDLRLHLPASTVNGAGIGRLFSI
jgi:hypothetical protein